MRRPARPGRLHWPALMTPAGWRALIALAAILALIFGFFPGAAP